MIYKSRLKVICKDDSLIKKVTYSFVNETTNKSTHNNFKLDSNNCTQVFDCGKNDVVKFFIYIDKKLHMRVRVKPTINGRFLDSTYYLPSLFDNKNSGNTKNSNGNAVFVPYLTMQHYEDAKKNKEKQEQSKKDNKEKVEKAVETVTNASSAVGVMLTGAKVFEKDTFHWGVIHTNGPQLATQRMQEVLRFKMYHHNNDTNRVFNGNQHIKVQKVKPILDKLDEVNGHVDKVGSIKDGLEIYGLVKEKDAEGLSSKVGELAGGKAGEAVGASLAGVCTRAAIREITNPRNALVIGAACTAAYNYAGSKLGEISGKAIGETDQGVKLAKGVIDAVVILDKMETQAAEKAQAERVKKDPGLEHHPAYAD
ncbi:hypothetical protein [Acinetobacter sp. WCHAc060025]|uniref:hypothetical protein n=1 Tax=Acinetobacter sp. WCHAc060025 TaxID=2518625 RepID=UPI00102380B9|nr:hypothetical protein [Acinetobacter sp. WCHAc060025]RZG74506.1 hypothetical protein EXE09_13080 [Acinetobacter sp. WCHAc060025]